MTKYFVIKQATGIACRTNGLAIAFASCPFFVHQIPIENFFVRESHMVDHADGTEDFEVVFICSSTILVPATKIESRTLANHGGISAYQPAAERIITYTLTINATPIMRSNPEGILWFLEEVSKAEFDNGIKLAKIPQLHASLDNKITPP